MQLNQTAPLLLLLLALVVLAGHGFKNHGLEINRNVAALCHNNASGTRIQLNFSSTHLVWVSCQ